MISLNEFINKHWNEELAVPWGFKGECVSLVQVYLNECLGLDFVPRGNGNTYGAGMVKRGEGRYVNTPERGDIVCYDTPNDWNPYGHVAVYVGNNKVIEQWTGHGLRYGDFVQSQELVCIVRPYTALIPDGIKLSNEEVAREVLAGKWGNGQERKNKLTAAGYNYTEVQLLVDRMLGIGKPVKSNEEIAKEVLNGDWGNGADRKAKLQAAGYNYYTIQALVNDLLKIKGKSYEEVANEILYGSNPWGNGKARISALRQAGYDPDRVQAIINKKLGY